MNCPSCKKLLVSTPAGVSMCPDWRHWSSKPTVDVPEGTHPITSEMGALGAALAAKIDASFPFMRDAAAVNQQTVEQLFHTLAFVCVDAFVQQLEGRLSGAAPEEARTKLAISCVDAALQSALAARIGKMGDVVSRTKPTMN